MHLLGEADWKFEPDSGPECAGITNSDNPSYTMTAQAPGTLEITEPLDAVWLHVFSRWIGSQPAAVSPVQLALIQLRSRPIGDCTEGSDRAVLQYLIRLQLSTIDVLRHACPWRARCLDQNLWGSMFATLTHTIYHSQV